MTNDALFNWVKCMHQVSTDMKGTKFTLAESRDG